eukprot:scaffold435_cov342-Pavlova_lutheri.AAC.2
MMIDLDSAWLLFMRDVLTTKRAMISGTWLAKHMMTSSDIPDAFRRIVASGLLVRDASLFANIVPNPMPMGFKT